VRAVGFDVNGGPEVLRPVEVPVPVPGPGEVLIRVAYAGVNHGEVRHRLGDFGAPDGIAVPGFEVSGEIAEVGPDVAGAALGDPVAAYLPDGGGYAEYAVAPAVFAFPLDGVSLRDGGGAGLGLTTAYGLLTGAARLAAGDSVLIHAAAGGVGSAAAQMARALGAARVHGTVGSAAKTDYAKRFGYDAVHLREDFAAAFAGTGSGTAAGTAAGRYGEVSAGSAGRYGEASAGSAAGAFARAYAGLDAGLDDGGAGFDVVLDPVGGPARLAGLAALAPFGRLVVYGEAARRPDLTLPVRGLRENNRSVAGYDIRDLARRAPGTVRSHALAALSLLTSGAIRVDVTSELPLAEAARAHEVLQAGANVGKTLLAVRPA
jgi:NADPH2:quinone reductase